MIKIIVSAVALVVFTVGVYVNNRQKASFANKSGVNVVINSPEEKQDLKEETDEIIEEPTATPAFTPTLAPDLSPTASFLDEYKYPNSETIGEEKNKLILESYDDTNIITNWYKDLIKKDGKNVKNFVSTKTNGDVLNKLAGADSLERLEVEITKKGSEIKTTITVQVTNPD